MYSFDDFWYKYPRKLGKTQAMNIFNRKIKSKKDFDILGIALIKYLFFIKVNNVDQKYIMYGSTFMNRYMDYYELKESDIKTEEQKTYEEFMEYDK